VGEYRKIIPPRGGSVIAPVSREQPPVPDVDPALRLAGEVARAVVRAQRDAAIEERRRIAVTLIREGSRPDLPREARDFLIGLAERL
jgi:hypothetical protein